MSKEQVSFKAATNEKWLKFDSRILPQGIYCLDGNCKEIRGTGSTQNIPISCSTNNTYSARTGEIKFTQDESGFTGKTIVTQAGKSCDCDAYFVTFSDINEISSNSGMYTIGEVSNDVVCGLNKLVFSCDVIFAGVYLVNKEIRLEVNGNESESDRTITISYKLNGSASSCSNTKTITQKGKGAVVCNCSDLKITCNTSSSYSIPYSGTGNNYITAATYNYAGDCELGNIVVVGYSETAGNITAITGNNNTILLKVGQNPSSSLRYVSFNFSYTLNNVECTYQNNCNIEQKGEEIVTCNCSSVTNVGWIDNKSISSGGTTNEYAIVSSLTVSEGCEVSNISAIITEGSGYATVTTNNGKVYLNVQPNTSSDNERRITVKLRYNNVDCDNIVETFIQEKKAITCNCDSVTINNTEKTLDENSHNTAITTFSVSQGCSIESVSVTADCNYATATTQGNKINLVIGSNTANTRDFYVNVSYDGTPCTSKKIHVTQSGVNCDCSKLNIENIAPAGYIIPRMGIDGYQEILTITSNTCVVDEGNNLNLNFNPSGQGECIYDTTYNQWWLKNVSAYTEIGERTITVTPIFNEQSCSGINFKQDGCHCEEITIDAYPVPNDEHEYYLAKYIIPEECANTFIVYDESGSVVTPPVKIYLSGTEIDYNSITPNHDFYTNVLQDTTGVTEDNKRIFNIHANFKPDDNYDYETNTTLYNGRQYGLEVRISLQKCSGTFVKAFTRSIPVDYGLIMLPLMYRYVKEEIGDEGFIPNNSYEEQVTSGYPFSNVSLGTSVVYAPVGYLETTDTGLTVEQVVSHEDFVSFDLPITDYVYERYLSHTSATLSYDDNLSITEYRRYEKEYDDLRNRGLIGSADTLSNTESEKLIATNQFFFDYGEKTSYKQVEVCGKTSVDLQLRDYGFDWDYSGVCTEDNCRIEGDNYFEDSLLMESLHSKLEPNDYTNRMVMLDTENSIGNVYIVYGQGREFVPKDLPNTRTYEKEELYGAPHQYLFQYELLLEQQRVVRQIVKTNNKEIAYAHNLKVTLRPMYKGDKGPLYYFNPKTTTFGSNTDDVGFNSTEMEDFSFTPNNFRKLDNYLYCPVPTMEQPITYPMYYNIQFSTGLTNSRGSSSGVAINDHSKEANEKTFKKFPLNIFVHNNSNSFSHRYTKNINIASIDEKVTMETCGKSISFRVYKGNTGGTPVNVIEISYQTTTWDDTAEYILSSETSISEGVQEFSISDIPAFITLKFFNFVMYEDDPECETVYSSGLYKNIFISKNLKQIAIIYEGCEDNKLLIKDVITNISEGHDIW